MLKILYQELFKFCLNFLAQFHTLNVEWVEDLPNKIIKNTIYIVGGKEYPFHACFVCPRRECNQLIALDISPELNPRWRITEYSKGGISLNPSIYVTSFRCQCHYWVKKGKIHWAEAPSLFVPKENKLDPQSNN